MSIELQDEDGVDRLGPAPEAVPETGPRDRQRPHVSGDLPTVLETGPMFRRAVAGYDRFQVDTYVQWAEDELATADREREHLLAGQLRARAELDEARELLSHSSEGGEFLQLSRRIGSMLAAAADEAEGMRVQAESLRAEAEAERCAASAQAEQKAAQADGLVAGARTEAGRIVAEATARVQEMTAEARRIVADAERTGQDARAEAAARLAAVRQAEHDAAESAERLRVRALADAHAARLQARQEIVGMLSTSRDERRRADAEASATRERLDRDAAARRAALLAEVAELEGRLAVVRAELQSAPEPVVPSPIPLHVHARVYLDRLQERLARHIFPRGSTPAHSTSVAARDGRGTAA